MDYLDIRFSLSIIIVRFISRIHLVREPLLLLWFKEGFGEPWFPDKVLVYDYLVIKTISEYNNIKKSPYIVYK